MSESFDAQELYTWIEGQVPHLYLDVRNELDFERFHIEGPHEIELLNIPYFDFLEQPEQTIERLDSSRSIKVICAKEGSAKFIADMLEEFGFEDVSWLAKGIISWGNALIAKQIECPSHYRLWQFNRPGKASCSYGLAFGDELMLFDVSKNLEFYRQFADQHGLRISKIFETHLQADYISGGPSLADELNIDYIAHAGDFASSNVRYRAVVDGESITFEGEGAPSVLCTHSPGHTPGSTTYVIDERFMISGDTVFIVSVGRPDLGKKVVEWAKQLYSTLKNRICVLPDELLVLPSHYTDWQREANESFLIVNDFGTVKKLNESIYSIENENEFISWVEENMRPQPEEYNRIRRVNAKLDEVALEVAEELDLGKNQCAASLS
jgi:glyoxylase-like metal-dependent hydrolase (beta-lactamase superfamily II)/rhodanese-related sulfurtransferase